VTCTPARPHRQPLPSLARPCVRRHSPPNPLLPRPAEPVSDASSLRHLHACLSARLSGLSRLPSAPAAAPARMRHRCHTMPQRCSGLAAPDKPPVAHRRWPPHATRASPWHRAIQLCVRRPTATLPLGAPSLPRGRRCKASRPPYSDSCMRTSPCPDQTPFSGYCRAGPVSARLVCSVSTPLALSELFSVRPCTDLLPTPHLPCCCMLIRRP
jgi:hypothetical protein